MKIHTADVQMGTGVVIREIVMATNPLKTV